LQTNFASTILGTGSYLPDRLLTNQQLEATVETTNEWILERTGIANRHIAEASQATSDLAYAASLKAIAAAGITPQDLDAILVATVTGDQLMPSTACMLQSKLGCRSIMSLDISAACSGFVYGLSIADQFIKNGMFKNVLVIGAETLSRIINYEDRGTCILFGDGAGAAVVGRVAPDSKSRILSSHLGAQGDLGDVLSLVGGGSRIPFSQEVLDKKLHLVQMKGREVFKAAVRALVDRAREALVANSMSVSDIDWVVVHQANTRIIDAVSETLDIPKEKMPINIRDTGNTSSASIPILFDESVGQGKIRRGDVVLFVAFGAGLTSGSLLFRY
jgi:3-oxoacyl-[acyl-carrier-protein] synthase-3